MIRRLLEKDEQLVATKYFTSRISGPPDKVLRQNAYIDALAAQPGVQTHFGVYQTDSRICKVCGSKYEHQGEKQTDVNIAVELLVDAHRDVFDTAIVMSADSDLVPAILALKALFPAKQVLAFFPPGRGSVRIEQEVHGKRRVRQWAIESAQLPDVVLGLDGYPRKRPQEWAVPPNSPPSPPANDHST